MIEFPLVPVLDGSWPSLTEDTLTRSETTTFTHTATISLGFSAVPTQLPATDVRPNAQYLPRPLSPPQTLPSTAAPRTDS